MVVDRMHRAARLLAIDGKDFLRPLAGGAFVERHVGGVILNHLGWAAAIGVRCGIFGRQGGDEEGRFLRATMDERGIARDILEVDEPTSLSEIFVDDAGERAIYMAAGATSATTAEQVRERHAPFIARARRLTTEVSQLPLAAAFEALQCARATGVETWVDFDVPPSVALASLGSQAELDAVLESAQLLKPSKLAVDELFGAKPGTPALDLARAVRDRFGNDAVIVTDGARGCAIAANDYEGSVPAPAIEVVDTTGVGDAFLGGLLAALTAGIDWAAAGAFSNALGAVCARQLGAFPLNPDAARDAALELYDGPIEPLQALRKRASGSC
jgi:ribokinase